MANKIYLAVASGMGMFPPNANLYKRPCSLEDIPPEAISTIDKPYLAKAVGHLLGRKIPVNGDRIESHGGDVMYVIRFSEHIPYKSTDMPEGVTATAWRVDVEEPQFSAVEPSEENVGAARIFAESKDGTAAVGITGSIEDTVNLLTYAVHTTVAAVCDTGNEVLDDPMKSGMVDEIAQAAKAALGKQ